MLEKFDDDLKSILRKIEFDNIIEKNARYFNYVLLVSVIESFMQDDKNNMWRNILDKITKNYEEIKNGLTKIEFSFDKGEKISKIDILNNYTEVIPELRKVVEEQVSGEVQNVERRNVVCLKKFSINLNMVESLPLIGREKEVELLEEAMLRTTKPNAVLIGDAGVGKTAIVEGLAHKIKIKQCHEFFYKKEILQLSMSSILAGTRYRGDFEERITNILREAEENTERFILFIDEIHTIVGSGGGIGGIDAGNILKPYLARGKLRVIGATTVKEYTETIVKDTALSRRFYPIYVNELNREETKEILKNINSLYSSKFGVILEENMLDYLLEQVVQKVKFRLFPDKAIDILELVFSRLIRSGENITNTLIDDIVKEYVKNFSMISSAKGMEV